MDFINTSDVFVRIASILIGLLSFASFMNWALLKANSDNNTLSKVSIIIKSWWGIMGVVLLAGFFKTPGFMILFFALSVLTVLEYFKRTKIPHYKTQIRSLLIFGLIIQVALLSIGDLFYFTVFPVIYSLIAVPLIIFRPKTSDDLPRYLAVFFSVLFFTHYILYSYALIKIGPKLLGSFDSTLILFFLVLCLTQLNDIFQFLFGKMFGKRKIVPHLSPNKTEAGFLGGLGCTSLLGMFLFSRLIGVDENLGLLMGASISLFGIFGDLTFSTVKRFIGIKDFSDAIPGHGGYLDRMDSIIFTSPILFHLINYVLKV